MPSDDNSQSFNYEKYKKEQVGSNLKDIVEQEILNNRREAARIELESAKSTGRI